MEQLEQDISQMLMPDTQGEYLPAEDAFIRINAQLSDSSQAREEDEDGESAYEPDQDFEEDDEDYFSGNDVQIGEQQIPQSNDLAHDDTPLALNRIDPLERYSGQTTPQKFAL